MAEVYFVNLTSTPVRRSSSNDPVRTNGTPTSCDNSVVGTAANELRANTVTRLVTRRSPKNEVRWSKLLSWLRSR